MSDLDRMAVVARCVLPTCQNCGKAEQDWWDCDRSDCGNHRDLKTEEWVHASQLAGVVEALELLCSPIAADSPEAAEVETLRRWHVAKATLARLGGQ